MQKHTSAYYALMLIGLIYSVPSAPMFSRVGTSTRQTATSTMRQPYATQQYGSWRFYTTQQPKEQSWWSRLWYGKRVEAPATMQQPYNVRNKSFEQQLANNREKHEAADARFKQQLANWDVERRANWAAEAAEREAEDAARNKRFEQQRANWAAEREAKK